MFAFERTGGDAGKDYALVVVNSNARKPGTTADGANVMQVAARGRLVDVLDPGLQTFDVAAGGTLRITVPTQRAMILVPQDQVVQGL